MSVSQSSSMDGQRAEQHSCAFRISLAAAIGFTLGHLCGGRPLHGKYAVGFVVLMAVGCIFSLLIAGVFIDKPANFALVFALLIFLEFLALARGKAAAGIFLITTSFVPLMALSSLDLAHALVHDLIV